MATGTSATGTAIVVLTASGITRAQWDTVQSNMSSEIATLGGLGIKVIVSRANYDEENPTLS